MNRKLQIVVISRRHQSHLMRRRRWLTNIFSSRVSSATRLPRLSSSAMKLLGSIGRGENRYRVVKAEKCKGAGAVASVDVFEAGALDWYLKPQSEELDASGRYKSQPQLNEDEVPPR